MYTDFVTEQQREYLQKCAELTQELARLLPELESGKATAAQKADALAAAQFLRNTGDNVAFLARRIAGQLDPVTPDSIYRRVTGQEQPAAFTPERKAGYSPTAAEILEKGRNAF